MPKYLITATAYRRAEQSESYSPRTFTFAVSLDAPWNGKNSGALNDVAFHECYRTYGFWPKQAPQIDSVVEVSDPYREALQKILDTVAGAEQNDVWDHIHPGDILGMIPTDPDGLLPEPTPTVADWTETQQPETPADIDADDLI